MQREWGEMRQKQHFAHCFYLAGKKTKLISIYLHNGIGKRDFQRHSAVAGFVFCVLNKLREKQINMY